MNQDDRDFKKVLESINSLEKRIINLELFVRKSIVKVHELSKQDITNQHKVNINTSKQIGQILDLISAQGEAIQTFKNG